MYFSLLGLILQIPQAGWLRQRSFSLKSGSWKSEIKVSEGLGNSLAIQWLGLFASTAGGTNLIPDQELRSHMPRGMAKKKKVSAGLISSEVPLLGLKMATFSLYPHMVFPLYVPVS